MSTRGQALDDPERLAALRAADLSGEVSLEALERISRLVVRLLQVDTALVNIVDDERQTTIAGTSENPSFPVRGTTPLSNSFCQHVVRDGEPFVVTDSREDARLNGNLGVTEDHVIAYLGVPLRSPDGHVLGALCAIDDHPRTWSDADRAALGDLGAIIADELSLRSATREIERLARIDPLTGLGNRRWWDDRARRELSRASRQGAAVSVVLFDLDGFKNVNDTLGHAAGDDVLRAVGQRWYPLIRAPDLLVRWGGDEFAVLLTAATLAEARMVAARLVEARPTEVGVSWGAAEWEPPETLEGLVSRADEALYAVKRAR